MCCLMLLGSRVFVIIGLCAYLLLQEEYTLSHLTSLQTSCNNTYSKNLLLFGAFVFCCISAAKLFKHWSQVRK